MRKAQETELTTGTLFEVFEKDGTPVWTRFVGARHHGRSLLLDKARKEQASVLAEPPPKPQPSLKWEPRREYKQRAYVDEEV